MGDADKTAVLTIRMRPSQKELVQAAARAAGVSASTWARRELHDAAREQFRELLRAGEPDDAPEDSEPTPERLKKALEKV